FFDEWGRERAKTLEVNGVYIGIFKEPPHLQIEVGNETRKKTFTLDDRHKLRNLLVEKFKNKKYDEGLVEAVAFVHDAMKTNTKQAALEKPTAPPSGRTEHREPPAHAQVGGGGGGGGGWGTLICFGLVAVLAIWVIFGLIRAVTGMGRGG